MTKIKELCKKCGKESYYHLMLKHNNLWLCYDCYDKISMHNTNGKDSFLESEK